MKKRMGFVSNSSTSSFVCFICEEGSIDYEHEDSCECEKGHTFHGKCASKLGGKYKIFKEHYLDIEEKALNDNFLVKKEFCPLCNFDVITDEEILAYLVKNGISKDEIRAKIKTMFKDRDMFLNYVGIKETRAEKLHKIFKDIQVFM